MTLVELIAAAERQGLKSLTVYSAPGGWQASVLWARSTGWIVEIRPTIALAVTAALSSRVKPAVVAGGVFE